MESSKVKCNDYDGKGDVKVFLTKIELVASLKGYDEEKTAQFTASKLSSAAFDVYMRLSDEDKKNFPRLKEELLKEFEKGQLNREEAIHLLANRRREPEESPQTYAYKLLELVKLAYPSFTEGVRKTITKDYFVQGVHPEMQIALKSGATFKDSDVNALANETVRLELAGIKSFGVKKGRSPRDEGEGSDVSIVSEAAINSIAEKVIEKLQIRVPTPSGGAEIDDSRDRVSADVNYASNYTQSGYRGRNFRGRGRFRGSARGRGNQTRKCRSCQSTEHLIRECPTRFCQACGNRGHDQSSTQCPNYQS